MTQVIFGLLLSFASASIDNKQRFTNHLPRWIIRLIATLILGLWGSDTLWLYVSNVLVIGITFYATFDYFLNLLEKRDIFYIGNTAKTDILWRRLGDNAYLYQLLFKLLLTTIILIIHENIRM